MVSILVNTIIVIIIELTLQRETAIIVFKIGIMVGTIITLIGLILILDTV